MFARRSFIFAWAGGLVAGTIMFGDPNMSMRRAFSKYQLYFCAKTSDPRGSEDSWNVKINN